MKAVLEEVKPRALMIVLFHGERLLGFRVDRFLTVINQKPSASSFKVPYSKSISGGKLAFLALLSQTFVIFGSNSRVIAVGSCVNLSCA